jgi:hypothetical protein
MAEQPAYIQAYAVLRVENHAPEPPREYNGLIEAGPSNVKVKEIVMTAELARSEVVRLNKLNAELGCAYYFQSTHVFLDGGSHGSRPREVS